MQHAPPDDLNLRLEAGPDTQRVQQARWCADVPPLARLELQEALRALVTELPGLHLASAVEWKTQLVIRGPRSMPIGW